MSYVAGGKILCFHCADLSKFNTNLPNIERVMTSCAIWHSWE